MSVTEARIDLLVSRYGMTLGTYINSVLNDDEYIWLAKGLYCLKAHYTVVNTCLSWRKTRGSSCWLNRWKRSCSPFCKFLSLTPNKSITMSRARQYSTNWTQSKTNSTRKTVNHWFSPFKKKLALLMARLLRLETDFEGRSRESQWQCLSVRCLALKIWAQLALEYPRFQSIWIMASILSNVENTEIIDFLKLGQDCERVAIRVYQTCPDMQLMYPGGVPQMMAMPAALDNQPLSVQKQFPVSWTDGKGVAHLSANSCL